MLFRCFQPGFHAVGEVAAVVLSRQRRADVCEWRSPISIATGGRVFLEENLGGRAEAQAGARAVVEKVFHPVHLLMRDVAEVGPLGKILADETIGVFVRTTLIRTPRIGKV
jgi:hypothetical protein